jgi:hypothetical protein
MSRVKQYFHLWLCQDRWLGNAILSEKAVMLKRIPKSYTVNYINELANLLEMCGKLPLVSSLSLSLLLSCDILEWYVIHVIDAKSYLNTFCVIKIQNC